MVVRKEGNLAKVAELQHTVIPSPEEDIEAWVKEEYVPTSSSRSSHHHKMLSDFVSADAIATDERGFMRPVGT